jgi:ABC-2 type transport system permease protein
MRSIYIKEIRSFLSSLIAYIVIIVFLLAIGLFMWVYPDTNVLDFGYANMDTLFSMSPWVLMFLISAITMRSFSEERKTGTIELLTTQAVTDSQIILGKYLAGLTLVVFAIIPTFIYYYTIHHLGSPQGNLDSGAIAGSYIGLLLLSACYVSIGVFSSSITDSQIVAFVLSMFLCFVFYSAFEQLSKFNMNGKLAYWIEWIGIDYHYRSISRGVVDTRDVLYFFSFIAFFLGLTKLVFGSRKW